MKRLIIDIGNTLTKVAVFSGNDLVFRDQTEDIDPDYLNRFAAQFSDIKSSILSSVKHHPESIEDFLRSRYFFISLDHTTKIPLLNKYKTPETLGKDRIALAVGGMKRFPGSDVLIIDAGTTITYDLVTSNKEYLGGGISPGIKIRFKALNTFTGKLPLINEIKEVDLVGNDTISSIQSGVLNGVVHEMDGMTEAYKSQFTDLKIAITGGDHIYFVKKLKNSIFATPNLVMEGLNEILIFNEGS